MTETRRKNPIKEMAILLAHQMEEEKDLHEGIYPPWKEEQIKECGREIRDIIWRKGYDIHHLLFLVEEYKSLTWDNYREWVYI